MKVEVKLFAVAKQIANAESVAVELADRATVGQLRDALVAQFPGLAPVMSHIAVAVNAQYSADDVILTADSEVACIPPVSGG
ncbi:MAG: molybdopterin synthase sulfur carrier subunit [Planctomycetaceae bacterium]|jgi:molybdopterin converting factor subunit 1|nr:molybdopterin synthase sulfur carrier subunit [Planctomycetaceae bacterium]